MLKSGSFLQNAATGGAALVEHRFRDAISAGEIPSDFPVGVRASQLIDLARGLTMRALIGTPRKTLLRDAEEAADLVLLSRPPKSIEPRERALPAVAAQGMPHSALLVIDR